FVASCQEKIQQIDEYLKFDDGMSFRMYDTSRCYFVTWFFGDSTLLRVEKWGEEGKYPGAIYMVVTSSRGRFRCAKTAYGLRIRSAPLRSLWPSKEELRCLSVSADMPYPKFLILVLEHL